MRSAVLEVVEASLLAKTRAIRSLRSSKQLHGAISLSPSVASNLQGRSHIDMTLDLLLEARHPLHVTEITKRIASRFGVAVDR